MVTYTDNKKLNKPANGEFPDTWDVPVNQDWDIIDKALGSAVQFTVGASDITLTISDAQNQRIVLTGTPGASRYIIIPFKYLSATTAVGGMWIVDNQTNADQYVVTEAPGSTGVTVATGRKALVYSDGTDVKFADETRISAGAGITVSGSQVSLSVPVAVTSGGTGLTTLTSGNVILGNGTGNPTFVAPGTIGNVLTSNGSSWISSAPTGGSGGGITSITLSSSTGLSFTPNTLTTPGGTMTLSGTLSVSNGGTGNTSLTGLLKGNGTGAITGGATVNLNSGSTDITGTLSVANGGTGVTKSTGTGSVVLSDGPTFTSTTKADSITASGTIRADELRITNATSVIYLCNTTTTYIASTTSLFGVAVGGSSAFSASATAFVVPGSMTAANYITSSDARIKKNIAPYNKSLADLTALSPVTFQYNGQYGTVDNGVTYVGLIAQDVQASSMNSMVTTRTYIDPKTGQKTDVLGISQNDIIFALINAVKDLDQRVKALETKVGP